MAAPAGATACKCAVGLEGMLGFSIVIIDNTPARADDEWEFGLMTDRQWPIDTRLVHAAPRVSVLIPCYIRPDDLRNTLRWLDRQTGAHYEVVVVDDGSPGDAIEEVVKQYTGVRYERTPHNMGLIAARNFGARLCRGDYIVNLDDDSWPIDPDALERIVEFMDQDPLVGVAALNIATPKRTYWWEADEPPEPVPYYVGCGNVYRRDVLDKIGGYVEEFRRQGEEAERSLRVWDAGYRVMSLPSVKVYHNESPINRDMRKHYAFDAANYLRREVIRTPLALLPMGILRWIVFTARRLPTMNRSLVFTELMRGKGNLLVCFTRLRRPVRARTYINWLRLAAVHERRRKHHAV